MKVPTEFRDSFEARRQAASTRRQFARTRAPPLLRGILRHRVLQQYWLALENLEMHDQLSSGTQNRRWERPAAAKSTTRDRAALASGPPASSPQPPRPPPRLSARVAVPPLSVALLRASRKAHCLIVALTAEAAAQATLVVAGTLAAQLPPANLNFLRDPQMSQVPTP